MFGLIPFGLGVYGLVAASCTSRDADAPLAVATFGVLTVAGVTVANGADNIAVYTPLFRTTTLGDWVITAVVFGVMVAV